MPTARRSFRRAEATSLAHFSIREFVSLSLSAGWTPLICWHQLEELFRHPDEEIAAQRVRFIRALPALAWISTASVPKDIGSICDILVCEVAVVVENRCATLLEVREAVRRRLLCFGTGSEALKDWVIRGAPCVRSYRSVRLGFVKSLPFHRHKASRG